MTDQWQLFLFLAGLIAAWSLVILGTAKWMMNSTDKKVAAMGKTIEQLPGVVKQMAELVATISRMQTAEADCARAMERRISDMRVELPTSYVRKEDYIRSELVINTKLDQLRDLIENKKRLS